MLGVPGQYKSVALMLSHKMDFDCCANRDGLANPVTNITKTLSVFNDFINTVTYTC